MSVNCRFNDLPIHCDIDFSGVPGVPSGSFGLMFTFYDSSNFTGNVKVCAETNRADGMFMNCTNFNGTVFLSPNVTNCYRMFEGCTHFNSPVTNTGNVTNCVRMYYGCSNFDMSVTIGSKVTSCDLMFAGCTNFTNMHQPLVIPNSVTRISQMLIGCYNFTSDIIIGTGVIDAASLFQQNRNGYNNWFNSRVEFRGTITSFYGTFEGCENYNKPFIFPEVTQGCSIRQMFRNCFNFSQALDIPEGVEECYGVFINCNNFNSPVTIPSTANTCSSMFYACTNFSQDLYVPDDCFCNNILRSCINFHSSISIPYAADIGIYPGYYISSQGLVGATVYVRESGEVRRIIKNEVTNRIYWDNNGNSGSQFDPSYNSPTIIPDGTVFMAQYFMNCSSYDQPTTIPNSVKDCSHTFAGCDSFNSEITFAD